MKFIRSIIVLLVSFLIIPHLVYANDLDKDYEEARKFGEDIGYYDGLKLDNMPDLPQIIEKYESIFPYIDDPEHEFYFIQGYRDGFKKALKEKEDKDAEKESNDIEYANILG
ncbi:MAG: hypothetical protein GX069_06400, partial [Tissierellia bacterium]|nr:hypothetical protein [Tissierellia bacterium]